MPRSSLGPGCLGHSSASYHFQTTNMFFIEILFHNQINGIYGSQIESCQVISAKLKFGCLFGKLTTTNNKKNISRNLLTSQLVNWKLSQLNPFLLNFYQAKLLTGGHLEMASDFLTIKYHRLIIFVDAFY